MNFVKSALDVREEDCSFVIVVCVEDPCGKKKCGEVVAAVLTSECPLSCPVCVG